FFASRGRHTRFSRDWSSDVCSSDLAAKLVAEDIEKIAFNKGIARLYDLTNVLQPGLNAVAAGTADEALKAACRQALEMLIVMVRSEERRVGKEWRTRWAADRCKSSG